MSAYASKRKYTWRHEPDSWKNLAQKKNVRMFGSNHGGQSGKRRMPKGVVHPIGFSGRTLAMKRR